MNITSNSTELIAKVLDESFIYYFDLFGLRKFGPDLYIGKIDSIIIEGNTYYENLYFGNVFGLYDTLTLSPNIGILMYYKNGQKYELVEKN
jgi:hypothetical protein